jgi:hypothetical protein
LQFSSSVSSSSKSKNLLLQIQDELIEGDYYINPQKSSFEILLKYSQVVEELSTSFDNLSLNLESINTIKSIIRKFSFEDVVNNKYAVFVDSLPYYPEQFSVMIKNAKRNQENLKSEVKRIFKEKLDKMLEGLQEHIGGVNNGEHANFLRNFKVYKTFWQQILKDWSSFFQLIQVLDLQELWSRVDTVAKHFDLEEGDFELFLDFDSELQVIQDMNLKEGFENIFPMHKFFNQWIKQCEKFLQHGFDEEEKGLNKGTKQNIVNVLYQKCISYVEGISQMMIVNTKDFEVEHWKKFLKILEADGKVM